MEWLEVPKFYLIKSDFEKRKKIKLRALNKIIYLKMISRHFKPFKKLLVNLRIIFHLCHGPRFVNFGENFRYPKITENPLNLKKKIPQIYAQIHYLGSVLVFRPKFSL